MKKVFILFVFTAFSILNVKAQIMLGPVTGVTGGIFNIGFFDTNSEAYFSSKYKIGFHLGATADIPFGGRFGFQPSILFSQKGNSLIYERTSVKNSSYTSTHALSYIEVPLLLKYKFGSPEFGFSVMAGPSFSFAVGGKYTEAGTIILGIPDNNGGYLKNQNGDTYTAGFAVKESDTQLKFGEKVNSNFKGKDIGFTFGIGTFFEVGESGKLIIEARYTLGSSNILNNKYFSGKNDQANFDLKKDANGNPTSVNIFSIKNYSLINDDNIINSVKNNSFQLSIGYLFEL